MLTDDQESELARIRAKRKEGRGIGASEAAFQRHAEKVASQIVKPRPRSEATRISEADTRTTMLAGKDTLAAAAGGGGGASTAALAALEARIAALETYNSGTLIPLVTGLTRQTVTYCSGGSSSSKTILMS
jgi:hypothetical protein